MIAMVGTLGFMVLALSALMARRPSVPFMAKALLGWAGIALVIAAALWLFGAF